MYQLGAKVIIILLVVIDAIKRDPLTFNSRGKRLHSSGVCFIHLLVKFPNVDIYLVKKLGCFIRTCGYELCPGT